MTTVTPPNYLVLIAVLEVSKLLSVFIKVYHWVHIMCVCVW